MALLGWYVLSDDSNLKGWQVDDVHDRHMPNIWGKDTALLDIDGGCRYCTVSYTLHQIYTYFEAGR